MIAHVNGLVMTMAGEATERGTVLIEDGYIAAVGYDLALPTTRWPKW